MIVTAVFAAKLQKENISCGLGHFRAGYSNYSMSSMNAWLSDFYFTIRNDFVSFGGSGYAVRNNLIIGSDGTGRSGATVSKDTLSIVPIMGIGHLNIS